MQLSYIYVRSVRQPTYVCRDAIGSILSLKWERLRISAVIHCNFYFIQQLTTDMIAKKQTRLTPLPFTGVHLFTLTLLFVSRLLRIRASPALFTSDLANRSYNTTLTDPARFMHPTVGTYTTASARSIIS